MSGDQTRETDWQGLIEEFNEATMEGLERALEEQTAFRDAWLEAAEEQTADVSPDGVDPEAFAQAYAVWIDATERVFGRLTDAIEGESVDPDELRDIWLDAANEAFSELMDTTAFAAGTGQTMGSLLDAQEAADESTRDLLHAYGLATDADVREVGERLVELERRHQRVEDKLDRLLEAQET